jgi:GTP-binding protein
VERETLASVLLLVDASIPPMPLDLACADWFAESKVPYTIVYTKLDKRKKGGPGARDNIEAFEAELEAKWGVLPPAIETSSKSGKGKSELLNHIGRLREVFYKEGL